MILAKKSAMMLAGGAPQPSFENLVSRHRADQGITLATGVSQWSDIFGSDHLAQGTAGDQPTWVADGGAGFNNRPVILWDGLGQRMFTSGGSVIAQPYTVVIISELTLDNGANKFLLDSEPGGGIGLCYATSGENVALNSGTDLFSSENVLNVPTLQEFLANGASSEIWVDGVSVASGNAGTGSRTGITVGTNRNDINPWGGDIAEILIYSAALSADQQAQNAAYTEAWYGIG